MAELSQFLEPGRRRTRVDRRPRELEPFVAGRLRDRRRRSLRPRSAAPPRACRLLWPSRIASIDAGVLVRRSRPRALAGSHGLDARARPGRSSARARRRRRPRRRGSGRPERARRSRRSRARRRRAASRAARARPRTCARAPARRRRRCLRARRPGSSSGPRTLKIVRVPSSRRTGAACFIAGWCAGANMKPKPSWSIDSAIRSGGCSSRNPSASSTSAEPETELTARLPCFATAPPAAAATSAAAVEMLKVRAPSPPVPTTSTTSVARRVDREDVLAHRLGATRDLVGGLALRPQRDEEAADLRGRRLAAHDLAHHRRALARGRASGRRAGRGSPPGSPAAPRGSSRPSAGPSGVSTLSGWNWTPSTGYVAVPDAHDLAVRRARRDLELVGDRALRRASGSGPPRSRPEAREDTAAVVADQARLAVQQRPCAGRPRRRTPRRSPGGRGRRRASARSGRGGGSARPTRLRPPGGRDRGRRRAGRARAPPPRRP